MNLVVLCLSLVGLWTLEGVTRDTFLSMLRPAYIHASVVVTLEDRYGSHRHAGLVTVQVKRTSADKFSIEFLLQSKAEQGNGQPDLYVEYAGDRIVRAQRIFRPETDRIECDDENPQKINRELQSMGLFLSDWVELLVPSGVGKESDWKKWLGLDATTQTTQGGTCHKEYTFDPVRNRVSIQFCDGPNKIPRAVDLVLTAISSGSGDSTTLFMLPTEVETKSRKLTSRAMVNYLETGANHDKMVNPCGAKR